MSEKKTRKVSICEDPDQQPLRMKIFAQRLDSFEEEVTSPNYLDEEEESTAEVPVPPDGGWGWYVCIAGFLCNLILDGTAYTFGVLMPELVKEFDSDRGSVSWVGSLLCGMYMLSGPLVGGLVNRFGNRPVCISGGIVACISISLSTLSVNLPMMIILYGIIGGFGLGLIYLPAVVAVGHYFESKRALATGITVCGSGVGTFLFAPLASYLLDTYSWKTSNLIFASFFLICILCGLVMKPLEILPPGNKKIERLALELPDGTYSDNDNNGVDKMTRICEDEDEDEDEDDEFKEPKKPPPKKYRRNGSMRIKPPSKIDRNFSAVQLKSLRPRLEPSLSTLSMSMSTASIKPSQSEVKLARPFSRKDIFFAGSMTNFDVEGEIVVRPNTLSYVSLKDGALHQCLSRASLTNVELKDSNSILDVIKSMMDFSLLKDPKFLLVGVSNIFGFLGFYIPFIYLPSLVESQDGISESQAAMVLSVIGISNTVGRILTGLVADRPWADPLALCSTSLVLSAVCVAIFPLIQSYWLYLVVAVIFGLVISAYIALTSIMLVDLVGIENLTTGFGVVTMFRGAAAIVGPPIGGLVYEATQSYFYSFMVSAAFFLISGIFSFIALVMLKKEIKSLEDYVKRPL